MGCRMNMSVQKVACAENIIKQISPGRLVSFPFPSLCHHLDRLQTDPFYMLCHLDICDSMF